MFEVPVSLHEMTSRKVSATDVTFTGHTTTLSIMHLEMRLQTHFTGHSLPTCITSETYFVSSYYSYRDNLMKSINIFKNKK